MNPALTISTTPRPENATEAWFERHADYLFHYAAGQVRDRVVAEDLVQETFLAALRNCARFSGHSSERTWLVGILRHKIYDHLRRHSRERSFCCDALPIRADQENSDEAMVWAYDIAEECAGPSRRMELAEFRQNLEMALGKLPPRLAQVFQLYEIEERPNSEVCAALQISETNLWVMLHRARKQLRDHLSNWWQRKSDVGSLKS
ncbi:MAG: sigma-70 family RNA polymerase sigma factor [Verrucomicrobiota bacterium]